MNKVSVLILLIIAIILPSSKALLATVELPDLFLYYQGKISLQCTYAESDGNVKDFIIQHGLPLGFKYHYIIDLELEGDIKDYYITSSLYYPFYGKPEFTLSMENHSWLIDYRSLDLKIPQLKTSISDQKLEGLKISKRDQTTHLFHGRKLFKSKKQNFTARDGVLVYSLFPSTSGNMVEYSEVVYVQGELLQRYIDYKINYLSGDLTFLIPLRLNALVEVKYNFIPTGDEINDTLTGFYYQYDFNRSYLSVFYLDEYTEELVEREIDYVLVEEIEETKTRYLGSALNLTIGSFSVAGEVAYSDPLSEEVEYGGNINLAYSSPQTTLSYDLTTASSGYTGIGVVPITIGEKHQFTWDYIFNPQWQLELELTQVEKDKDTSPVLNRIADTNLNYLIHPKHKLIFTLNANSVSTQESSIGDLDYQIGWNYQINPQISLAIKNSLQRPEGNHLVFQINSYELRLKSEYEQYPELLPSGSLWVRQAKTDFTYRPFVGTTLTGNLDYWQPFDQPIADSRRRVALTLLLMPNSKINTRTNYVYFYNPRTKSQTNFYDINTTFILPYNIKLEGSTESIVINSQSLINTDRNWHTAITIPFFNKFTLKSSIGKIDKEVFLKSSEMISQSTDTLNVNIGIDYRISDFLLLSLSQNHLNSIWGISSSYSGNIQDKYELGINYFKSSNLFKYQIAHVEKIQLTGTGDTVKEVYHKELKHSLTWENKMGPLQYNYSGEISYPLGNGDFVITDNKQSLTANWMGESSPVRPSIQLSYISKNSEEQNWIKYKFSGKLVYQLNRETSIFAELGRAATFDQKNSEKDYSGKFIKTGVEYTF